VLFGICDVQTTQFQIKKESSRKLEAIKVDKAYNAARDAFCDDFNIVTGGDRLNLSLFMTKEIFLAAVSLLQIVRQHG